MASGLLLLVHGVTLTGTVTWSEPNLAPAQIAAQDPAVCKAVRARDVRVDDRGRVAGAVVSFDGAEGPPLAATEVTVHIRGCRFEPRVLALGPQSSLRFHSHDPVLHNVTVFDPEGAPVWSVNLVTAGQRSPPVVLKAPGRYRVRSRSGHRGMNAHVWVRARGPAVRTDALGRFEVEAPEGATRLQAWHPDLGVTEAAWAGTASTAEGLRLEF